MRRFWRWVQVAALVLVLLEVVLSPALYFYVLNSLGPSTEYYEPSIIGAVERLPTGEYVAYVGDKVYVTYIVVRHKINGNCLLSVERYGEEVGGPRPGTRHLLDYAELQFIGQNELRRPRWPINGLILGYDVDRQGRVLRDRPLLAPGVDSQAFDFYVVARYYCNFMDDLFPRYIQGGLPDETERVRLIVKRRSP